MAPAVLTARLAWRGEGLTGSLPPLPCESDMRLRKVVPSKNSVGRDNRSIDIVNLTDFFPDDPFRQPAMVAQAVVVSDHLSADL